MRNDQLGMKIQTTGTPAERAAEYLKRVAALTGAERVRGDSYWLRAGRRNFYHVRAPKERQVSNMSLYSIRYAQHGKDLIRVGHDEFLRWYMSLDGEKWTPVEDHTLKSAQDYAHSCLHQASEKCSSEKLAWKMDKSTQEKVLGECPRCANPSMESDLKTFRRCPDCGWRIDFTKEQIEWAENKLHVRRSFQRD